MTCKGVEIHASHLPRRTARNRSPLGCTKFQRSQHLEWHIRNFGTQASGVLIRELLLECLKLASNFRQRIERVFAADEVTEQCFARSVLWLWVDHLHNIS